MLAFRLRSDYVALYKIVTRFYFYAPSRFDDEIEIHVRTGKIGRSSLEFLIEVFLKDSETTLAKGDVVWMNTDQKFHKSTPLSEALVLKLREKEGSKI